MLLLAPFALAADLPDGPGKDAALKVCTKCHGLEPVVGLRRTRAVWDATVDDMATRGATATDAEFDAVVNYLVRFFGKANINTATAKEIEEAIGFSAEQADAIVRYRSANGEFKDFSDLRKVPGLDPNIIDERKDRIDFH